MKFELYTVFDVAANEAGPLFQAVNDAVAARQFRHLVKEMSDPGDYKLYRVGHYDNSDMEIKPDVNPVEIFTGAEDKRDA